MGTPNVTENTLVNIPGSGKCRVLYALEGAHWANPTAKGYRVKNVWTGSEFSVWL